MRCYFLMIFTLRLWSKKSVYIYIYIYTKNLTKVYGRDLLTDVNTTKSPCIVFINIYESIAQLQ